MNGARRALFSGGWWLSERVGALLLTLLTSVVLVRWLGPQRYGELAYLLAVVGLLVPLVQFGLSGLVARAVLEHPEQEQRIVRAALAWRSLGCLVAVVLGVVYWLTLEARPDERAVLLLLVLAQCATAYQSLEYVFQTRLSARRLVPWRFAALMTGAALKIAAAVFTRDPTLVATAFALEYLLLGLAYAGAYRRLAGVWARPGMETAWMRWIAARAPWLLASGFAEIVYLKIDVVMLERMRGVGEAGVYAVAARLSEAWYVLPVVIVGSMFPVLWARRGDGRQYQRDLQLGFDLLCAAALSIAIAMHWLAGPLVTLLFGAQFAASATVLVVHVWAGVFVFMRALLSRWLLAEDLLRFSLVTHLAGAIVNVAANLWLIPRHGAIGAAWATVLSYAVAGWLALFLSPQTRPIGVMMLRALLLPLRWRALQRYWHALLGYRRSWFRPR